MEFHKKLSSKVLLGLLIYISCAGLAFADNNEDESFSHFGIAGGAVVFEGDEEVESGQLYELKYGITSENNNTWEFNLGIMPHLKANKSRGNIPGITPKRFTLQDDVTAGKFGIDYMKNLGSRDSISPYIGLSGGGIYYDENLEDGKFDYYVGPNAGLRVPLDDNWFLRGDYRLVVAGSNTEVNNHFLLTLGYAMVESEEEETAVPIFGGEDEVDESQVALRTVYFPYDSSQIVDQSKYILDGNVRWFEENDDESVTIEGYCDERGSDEYNLALGARRAQAVRDYLRAKGVANNRMKTISYGEENPVDPASNEAAWAKNRRAEFSVD